MTLGLSYDNQLIFQVPSCDVDVKDLSFDIHGFLHSVADWIIDEFSGDLEHDLDSQASSALSTATVQALQGLTKNSST